MGVGEDISFDLALIRRAGCHVWALDPTPRAKQYVESIHVPARLHYVEVGVAADDGEARFYAPRDARHVSHSLVNLHGGTDYFVAPVRTLSTIMKELGHHRVDLVKLDIEGAQHAVLHRMLEDGVLPRVVAVEFDQPEPIRRSWGTVQALRRAGYRVAWVEGFNVTMVLLRL